MKVRIFSTEPPRGRCLTLIQKLNEVTNLPSPECVALGERLFAFAHKRANAVEVALIGPMMIEQLRATCAELGLTVEVASEQ
jgi:hypothetical protein